jgi:hypothetical protein
VTELVTLFRDLPPMDAETFRAEQEQWVDPEAHFDVYGHATGSEDGE